MFDSRLARTGFASSSCRCCRDRRRLRRSSGFQPAATRWLCLYDRLLDRRGGSLAAAAAAGGLRVFRDDRRRLRRLPSRTGLRRLLRQQPRQFRPASQLRRHRSILVAGGCHRRLRQPSVQLAIFRAIAAAATLAAAAALAVLAISSLIGACSAVATASSSPSLPSSSPSSSSPASPETCPGRKPARRRRCGHGGGGGACACGCLRHRLRRAAAARVRRAPAFPRAPRLRPHPSR